MFSLIEHAQCFVAKYKIPLTSGNIGKYAFASSALSQKKYFIHDFRLFSVGTCLPKRRHKTESFQR